MFVDNKQIHIYCDVGKKRVLITDSFLNKSLFARTKKKERVFGEYQAILFALRYIQKTYKDRDILILTDGKSESDILNGNSMHSNGDRKNFSDNVKDVLSTVRIDNIINILWLPRTINQAGRILQRFNYERATLFGKTNLEEVDIETINPIMMTNINLY